MSDDHTPTFHTYLNGKSLTPTNGMLTCPDCNGGMRDGQICAICGGTGKVDAPAGVNLASSDPLERIWQRLDHLEHLIEDIGARMRDSVNGASMSMWGTPIWRTSTIVSADRPRHRFLYTFMVAGFACAVLFVAAMLFILFSLPGLPHFGAPVLADNATPTSTLTTAPTLTSLPSATPGGNPALALATATSGAHGVSTATTVPGMPTATPQPPILNLAPDPSVGLSLVCSKTATAQLSIGNNGPSPLFWTATSREASPGNTYTLNTGSSASGEVDPGDNAEIVNVTVIQYSGTITVKPAPAAPANEQFATETLAVTCVVPTPTALPTATPTATPTVGI